VSARAWRAGDGPRLDASRGGADWTSAIHDVWPIAILLAVGSLVLAGFRWLRRRARNDGTHEAPAAQRIRQHVTVVLTNRRLVIVNGWRTKARAVRAEADRGEIRSFGTRSLPHPDGGVQTRVVIELHQRDPIEFDTGLAVDGQPFEVDQIGAILVKGGARFVPPA
jgi:hypothetical protein